MNPEQLDYYRAVEDLFARLRGTPFLVSPKDFALLRKWWSEGVPLAAVAAGLGEVFSRRAEREGDPVSSLSYCRHAVAKHARRLAESAPGESLGAPTGDLRATVEGLARSLREAAQRWSHVQAVTAVLLDVARSVETLPGGAALAAADEALGRLELAALDVLGRALPAEERAWIERKLEADLAGLDLDDDARVRTVRALRRKHVREVVGLPRLEVPSGDR